jgi:hypothetical protein
MRWIIAIALIAIGIVAKVLADTLPVDGALGFVWRVFAYAVILHVLVFIIAFRLFKPKPPPENDS